MLTISSVITDGCGLEARWEREARLAAESVRSEAATLARHHHGDELVRRSELLDTEDLRYIEPLAGYSDRRRLLDAAGKQPFVATRFSPHLDTIIECEEADLAARKLRLEQIRQFSR
ncbi:MAG: hypothetical protein ABI224_02560 [Acetobacteraceae bacterium]